MSKFAEKQLNVRCQMSGLDMCENKLKTSKRGEFQIIIIGLKRKKWYLCKRFRTTCKISR